MPKVGELMSWCRVIWSLNFVGFGEARGLYNGGVPSWFGEVFTRISRFFSLQPTIFFTLTTSISTSITISTQTCLTELSATRLPTPRSRLRTTSSRRFTKSKSWILRFRAISSARVLCRRRRGQSLGVRRRSTLVVESSVNGLRKCEGGFGPKDEIFGTVRCTFVFLVEHLLILV